MIKLGAIIWCILQPIEVNGTNYFVDNSN